MDIGAALFQAASFRHAGYNVGVANLSERPLAQDAEGYYIATNGDRLRLFHFHAFDSSTPEKLSVRYRHTTENELSDESTVLQLCKEYADILVGYEQGLPPAEPYPYWFDTRGRRISRQLRRAYGREAQTSSSPLPSPFEPSEADAYERWRRQAWRPIARGLIGETAKCVRIVIPEAYEQVRKRFPKLSGKLNERFSGGSGLWG
jgi:hypothetical protein